MYKKNNIPWNKGLTKDDPRIADNLEKRKQTMLKKYGRVTITRVKGEWKPTEEARKKQSESAKKRWLRERDKIIKAQTKGKINSELFKQVHSQIFKDIVLSKKNNPEYQKKFKEEIHPKMIEGWKNSPKWKASVTSSEYRAGQSKASKLRWADPAYHDRVVSSVCKALMKRPTSPELKIIELMDKILPQEYKYVGDGQFILSGLCPDFVNTNGQKKIIEVFGRAFHDPIIRKNIPYYQTYDGRKEVFGRYGYETLIIWDDELDDSVLVSNRILEFNQKAVM